MSPIPSRTSGFLDLRALLPALLVLLGAIIAGAPVAGAKAGSPRGADKPHPVHHTEVRDFRINDMRFPVYSPSWSDGHPLRMIQALLEKGEGLAARRHWQRLLSELPGNLLLHPDSLGEKTPQRAIDRIVEPTQVLHRWFNALGSLRQELPVARFSEFPLPGSPLLWHPSARDVVKRQFAYAFEAADWSHVQLLLESPNTPDDDGRWKAWLFGQYKGLWKSSTTTKSAGLATKMRRIYQLHMSDSVDFRPTPLQGSENLRVPQRRTPLAAIFAANDGQHAVLQTGSRLFAIDYKSEHPHLAWEVSQSGEEPLPALLTASIQPVYSDRWVVCTPRVNLDENGLQRSAALDRRRLQLPWKRLWIARRSHGHAPTPVELPKLPAYSFTGTPLIVGDHLYVAAWRGWGQSELRLLALNLETRTLLWDRSLGSRQFHWHSARDIRHKVTEAQILRWGRDLIVVHGWGWISRVGRERGELRGVLTYPRAQLDVFRLPATPSLISGTRWSRLPSPRPRYPGPNLVVDRAQRPTLITLPADASELLAVDLEAWRIVWRHRVTPQTQLLGQWQDQVVLLDAGILKQRASVQLKRLNVDSGLLAADPQRLPLSVDENRWPSGSDAAIPLLSGVPRLFGETLWIPELDGLSMWTLPELDATSPLPSRYLAWPSGATGGTPQQLGGGRFLCIHRGDESLGTAPSLEIYETVR